MRFKQLLATTSFALLLIACGDFERGAPLPNDDTGALPPVSGENGGGTIGFAEVVLPALIDNCAQCHGAGSSTGLKLTGDPSADYSLVVSFVTPGNPGASSLLQKGSGATSHGGGGILSAESEEYRQIAAWIQAGALEAP